jgi:2-aminoadipate transaminase
MTPDAPVTVPASPPPGLSLSAKARRTAEQPISFLIATALHNPGLINFAAGLVDPRTLPVEPTAAIARAILGDPQRGRAALQYDTTQGLAALRMAVLGHLERLEGKPAADMGLTADHVLVTTGSQQALYLVGDALIDPGDIVIAANPSYFVYTGTLASLGATVLTVPTDDDGMDVDAVDRLLGQLERDGRLGRVKFVYCTSYFDNPTGLTLSAERRPRLLEVVRRFSDRAGHRILILEDAAYRELRYDGAALPSIKSFDVDNRYTVLAHTFSKPYAPGIKTGYTVMPDDLLHGVLQQKGNHDFGSANLAQHIALEAMRSGAYLEHGILLRNGYRAKRDAMLAALDRYMPKAPDLHWTRPHGGLYVWVTLPETFDTSRGGAMFRTCVDHGVLYVPGDYCFQPDAAGRVPTNHLRLSFGQVAPEQIEPGIERLASVVREILSRGAGVPPVSSPSRAKHGRDAHATAEVRPA